MNLETTIPTYTPEDLLRLPDGDRYELIDGRLKEKHMGQLSSWIGGEVYRLLSNFVREHGLGWVFPADGSYQCFARKSVVRKPDVSFVTRGKFPDDQIPSGHSRIPPDLAVEVVSPNDTWYEVEETVREYLEAGVPLVWVVSPVARIVYVFRADGSVTGVRENQELSGENVVPGFRCRVAAFFPPTPRS